MVKYYNEILTGLVFLAAVALPSLNYPAVIVLVALLAHSKTPSFEKQQGNPLEAEVADLKRQVSALALNRGLKR